MRHIRTIYFNTWASGLEDTQDYLAKLPGLDLQKHVADPNDEKMLRMARLDCDWYAENARVFSQMRHDKLEFLPARTTGQSGLADLLGRRAPVEEETWVIFIAQHPQKLEKLAPKIMQALRKLGYQIFYYAYDEASRSMPCFREIAPFISVLIHDENPLNPNAKSLLSPDCVDIHRSWVANIQPYEAPFIEAPEEKIIFLGSEMGLTPHRKKQVGFLKDHFKDRFIAYHDHSVSIAERISLSRFKVSLCPEGRMFATPGMSASHTDRPFWSGCLGMVPVSENSRFGCRLEALHQQGLILRYEHGDLHSLKTACEQALALDNIQRRRIYDYFNQNECIGRVTADAIAQATKKTG